MDITRVFQGMALLMPLYIALMIFVLPLTAIITRSSAKTVRVGFLGFLVVVALAFIRS